MSGLLLIMIDEDLCHWTRWLMIDLPCGTFLRKNLSKASLSLITFIVHVYQEYNVPFTPSHGAVSGGPYIFKVGFQILIMLHLHTPNTWARVIGKRPICSTNGPLWLVFAVCFPLWWLLFTLHPLYEIDIKRKYLQSEGSFTLRYLSM